MRENTTLFGAAKSLVGIITDPVKKYESHKLPAIVLLNSGLVHRVGLSRMHVKIARSLAAEGFVVFRFDFSGIGDSSVRRDHLPFAKSAVFEAQEAMDHLHAVRSIDHFVLIGICSGAAVSYKLACSDARVVGAVLINARGHLHGDDEELRTYLRNRSLFRHYWRMLLHSSFRAKNSKKALTGRILDYNSILRIMFGFPLKILFRQHAKEAALMNRAIIDLVSLTERGVRLLLIHSEGDEGLDYLHVVLGNELHALTKKGSLKFETIEGANHIFTLCWSQEHLLQSINNWAQKVMIDEKNSHTDLSFH